MSKDARWEELLACRVSGTARALNCEDVFQLALLTGRVFLERTRSCSTRARWAPKLRYKQRHLHACRALIHRETSLCSNTLPKQCLSTAT